jgi:hypothetical protein
MWPVKKGGMTPTVFSGVFRNFTRKYIAAAEARVWRGVRPFGSQAMRHIVAAATWKSTKDEHAMALAIYDSVRTAEVLSQVLHGHRRAG